MITKQSVKISMMILNYIMVDITIATSDAASIRTRVWMITIFNSFYLHLPQACSTIESKEG